MWQQNFAWDMYLKKVLKLQNKRRKENVMDMKKLE